MFGSETSFVGLGCRRSPTPSRIPRPPHVHCMLTKLHTGPSGYHRPSHHPHRSPARYTRYLITVPADRQLRTDLRNICEFQLALKSQRRCPRRCPTSIVTCCRTETIPTMSKKRCITDYWSRKPSKSVHVEKSPSTESLDQEVSPAPAPSISTHSQQKSGAERADNSSESAEILEADPYDSGASLRQFWLLQAKIFEFLRAPNRDCNKTFWHFFRKLQVGL